MYENSLSCNKTSGTAYCFTLYSPLMIISIYLTISCDHPRVSSTEGTFPDGCCMNTWPSFARTIIYYNMRRIFQLLCCPFIVIKTHWFCLVWLSHCQYNRAVLSVCPNCTCTITGNNIKYVLSSSDSYLVIISNGYIQNVWMLQLFPMI